MNRREFICSAMCSAAGATAGGCAPTQRGQTAALKAFCDYPIISDGESGCWFDGEFVASPKVEVLDTTAAGDTLLAERCWQFCALPASGKDSASPLGLRYAVAAGSAACTMPGGEPPDIELVEKLARGCAK